MEFHDIHGNPSKSMDSTETHEELWSSMITIEVHGIHGILGILWKLMELNPKDPSGATGLGNEQLFPTKYRPLDYRIVDVST